MGTAGWVILIVVVVVLVAGAAWALMGNRRTAAKREQATQLREEATENTAAVEASRREAEEAAARAEVARAEAERAEQQAAQAHQGVAFEEARTEDRLRTADRVDPDVDTRADDYRPGEPTPTATTSSETGGSTGVNTSGTSGAAVEQPDPADRTETDVAGRPLGATDRDVDPDEPVHEYQHVHRSDPR